MGAPHHRYTDEERNWIMYYATAKTWRNRTEFLNAFNKKFNATVTKSGIEWFMWNNKIPFRSQETENYYTDEQKQWILDNLNSKVWKNHKEFTDVFNAIFGTSKTVDNMSSWLASNGYQVNTSTAYTREQRQWIFDNYSTYIEADEDVYFEKMANAFNTEFNSSKTASNIRRLCLRAKLLKSERDCTFKKGECKRDELPIGTIRYSHGRPFIKVMLRNGCGDGVSYSEPYWKSLQKKIWEDHYGEVPDGFMVVNLTGDLNNTDINNLVLLDKRGKAIMAKKGWWSDNKVLTADGVQWCNLYYTAKDNGVFVNG